MTTEYCLGVDPYAKWIGVDSWSDEILIGVPTWKFEVTT